MTPDRWQLVESIFHAARERVYRSGTRASYIDLPIATEPVHQ